MLELDLSTVEPSLAGPRRPQDRVALSGVAASFDGELPRLAGGVEKPRAVNGSRARITNCTTATS